MSSEAELFVCGSIVGATGFPTNKSFYVSFETVVGNQWRAVSGTTAGNSHIMQSAHDGVSWGTPVDVHFAFQSVQGWPKISIRVWSIDGYGRKDLEGYGVAFVPMPTKLDEATITVSTWKPAYYSSSGFARAIAGIRQMVMGGNPVLRDDSLVHNNDSRFKLYTTSGGVVQIKLSVIVRNAEEAGIQFD
jgi:B9 domain-containing protein 2